MSRGRIRTVKPEWLTDERMLASGHEARILSIALNAYADDDGRGRWLENRMAHDVFAMDPDPLASLRAGVKGLDGWYFHRYRVANEGYYQVLKFRRHQRLEKAQASKLPASPELERVDTPRGPEFHFPASSVSSLQPLRDSAGTPPPIPRASLVPVPCSPSLIPDPSVAPTGTGGGELSRSFRSPQGCVVRSHVDDVFKAAKASTPTGADAEWNRIGKRLWEESERSGSPLAELAAAMARGFLKNPKARDAGWPVAWVARNPIQYVKEGQRDAPTPETFDDEENPL